MLQTSISRFVSYLCALFLVFGIVCVDPLFAAAPPADNIASVAVVGEGSALRTSLKIIGERRCHFGDIDAIFLELINSKHPLQTKLLLTVELLAPEKKNADKVQFAPTVKDLTKQAAKISDDEGLDLTLRIPKVSEPALAGIFICKEGPGGSGSCSDKKAVSIRQLMKGYRSRKPAAATATDKTYFFQPIVLSPSKVFFLSEDNPQVSFAQLLELLPEGARESSMPTVPSLDSLPLSKKENKIVLKLPGIDPAKCGF